MKLKGPFLYLLICICLVAFPLPPAHAASSTNYELEAGGFNEGGDDRSSASYNMDVDAIGQNVIGHTSSSNYALDGGIVAVSAKGPAPTGTITIDSGATFTNTIAATLALTCSDPSGCAEMQFSNDDISYSTPEAYSATKDWTLDAGDGTKTVYAKFKNGEGTWSSAYSDTIVLDTAAPATTASPVGGTYAAPQSVTLTCDDGTGSGCDTTYYCTGVGCSPVTLYSGAINIAASTDLRFYSTDLATNSEVVKTESYTITAAAPDPPTGVSISGMMHNGPLISWNTVSDATKYNIYRSPDNSAWSFIGTVSHPTSSYRDSTAPDVNTKYWWTVTAENGSGESPKPAGVAGRTALRKGWNIVSAPKATSGATATQVFGSWASWSWYWNSTSNVDPDNSGTWTQSFTVEPGYSLFVWAWNDSTVLSASGGANPASVTITLVPGWNLVSNQTEMNMTDIKTNWLVDGGPTTLEDAISGGTIENSLYWWNGSTWDTSNIVSENPTVEPWKGYWILSKDSVNHTLTIQ
jgi:hypothetical protein